MSEDVKPIQFTLFKDTTEEVELIEFEPSMRMMDEMAESFQEWLDDTEVDFSEQPGWKSCKESLEKYYKFKDGLK